jgi:hypothetical protein
MSEGKLTVYKSARGCLITLEIPEDSRRLNIKDTSKYRAEKAKVVSIVRFIGNKEPRKIIASDIDLTFVYKVGDIVEEKDFDDDPENGNSKGIHFFLSKKEALEWGQDKSWWSLNS